ncbi:MAG TPA: flagellar protein FliT [Solirubrobacteraceae bacterium]|nr:flagellar protein FliT [Solirubrobacteraceae bacterium]
MSETAAQGQGCAFLAEALDCTEALRLAVESGAWDRATELEERRRSLLDRFFARVTPPEELAEAVERLKRLAAANDVLIGIADHVQRALEREVLTVDAGRRAAHAYLAPT